LQVTPALARKLLASNANQLSETLQRQQQRWQQQQQQPASQPPAAVLLQYCLSDVSNNTSSSNAGASAAGLDQHVSSSSSSSSEISTELLGALRQLHGLPLLPAADGSLQTIKLQTPQQMHNNRQPLVSGSGDAAAVLYVPADPVEQQLLSQLSGQLLHPSVSGDLKQQLLQIAAAGVSNVRLITCRILDQHILQQLLPAAWYGQLEVEVTWSASSSSTSQDSALTTGIGEADAPDEPQQQQPQQQQREPSKEFIKLLWQWMAQRGDAAELAHWPVLPVAGGKLRLLQQPAQVRHHGCLAQLTLLCCCACVVE
jgi:sacsin